MSTMIPSEVTVTHRPAPTVYLEVNIISTNLTKQHDSSSGCLEEMHSRVISFRKRDITFNVI